MSTCHPKKIWHRLNVYDVREGCVAITFSWSTQAFVLPRLAKSERSGYWVPTLSYGVVAPFFAATGWVMASPCLSKQVFMREWSSNHAINSKAPALLFKFTTSSLYKYWNPRDRILTWTVSAGWDAQSSYNNGFGLPWYTWAYWFGGGVEEYGSFISLAASWTIIGMIVVILYFENENFRFAFSLFPWRHKTWVYKWL